MVKIFSYVAGTTLGFHEKFLTRLFTQRDAEKVDSAEQSDVIIVFCPIVSRVECDVTSALEGMQSKIKTGQTVILVRMHHTYDENYMVPDNTQPTDGVHLTVDCLFHETKGLLSCPCNDSAYKMICDEVNNPDYFVQIEPEMDVEKDDADPGEGTSAATTADGVNGDDDKTISLGSRRHEDPDAVQGGSQPGNINSQADRQLYDNYLQCQIQLADIEIQYKKQKMENLKLDFDIKKREIRKLDLEIKKLEREQVGLEQESQKK